MYHFTTLRYSNLKINVTCIIKIAVRHASDRFILVRFSVFLAKRIVFQCTRLSIIQAIIARYLLFIVYIHIFNCSEVISIDAGIYSEQQYSLSTRLVCYGFKSLIISQEHLLFDIPMLHQNGLLKSPLHQVLLPNKQLQIITISKLSGDRIINFSQVLKGLQDLVVQRDPQDQKEKKENLQARTSTDDHDKEKTTKYLLSLNRKLIS